MKFTFSTVSAILALVAVVQAAPAPTSASSYPTSSAPYPSPPSSTPGGGSPPTAPWTAVNPMNSTDTISGNAKPQPKGTKPPSASPNLKCTNPQRKGRSYSITCSGTRWYIWTDCTNGYLYEGGPIDGTFRATITCPAGSTASSGGAFGK
ncbi:hypothetical protein B0O80DRAFT_452075 [Mortierella sp. GBAus27b]|nr:hypothetical protein BGX31_007944 [Mortierella sp. GBA43]KAI8353438.1 hypothetical protein B0O80DRAFT_452075 [Mortierella sp. GBAus27b]